MRGWMLAVAVAGGVPAVGHAAEVLTVDQAISRALDQSAQWGAAKERQAAAEDGARATRGQMLPSLAVSEEFQHYDTPFDASLAFPGLPPGAPAPSFRVREQNTNTLAVAARQPLLGLARLSQEYSAANQTADAAEAQAKSVERSVREAVQTAFLRLFQARASVQVAEASEKQLSDQVAIQQARLKAGAGTNADVLRVEVAAANLHQQLLMAQLAEKSSRTQLLTLLALPLSSDVDFVEPTELEARASQPAPQYSDVTAESSFGRRTELLALSHQADAAEATARARLFALLPEVDAEAAYVNLQGQVLAEEQSKYIGVKLTWPAWTWGAQWYAHRAAAHQASASRFAYEDARRNFQFEAGARSDQLAAVTAAIEVAEKAQVSAQEAYRVTEAQAGVGSATTTDLLDAQAALTQAKLNVVRARYERALAWVQLQRASGE